MPHRFCQVVCPVYMPSRGDGWLEANGSAVLIEAGPPFEKSYWVLSASHVLNRKNSPLIFLPGKPDFFRITGDIFQSKDAAVIDLAYTKLSSEQASAVIAAGHSFLPATRHTLDHSGVPITEGDACTVVGYPIKRAIPNEQNRREISVQAMVYTGHLAALKRLKKFKRDPSHSLMVMFDRKVWIDGREVSRPGLEEVRGISGGAIWGRYSDNVRLLGIVHEYDDSRSVLLGTRCRVFPMMAHGKF